MKHLLLVSRDDPRSRSLFETINIRWDQYFDIIYVNKKSIKNILKNSKYIKINKIPCLLVKKEDGHVVVYEDKEDDEKVRNWIEQNILGIKRSKKDPIRGSHSTKDSHSTREKLEKEKLEHSREEYIENIGKIENQERKEGKTNVSHESSSNIESATILDDDILGSPVSSSTRRDGDVDKGIGHDKMAKSSLSGDTGMEPAKKQSQVVMKNVLQKAREMQEGREN